MLPVVLFGLETWLLILREERRLEVFEKRGVEENIWVIDGRGKGEWRKLRKKLNDPYCSPNIVQLRKIDKIEIDRACSV